MKLQRLIVLPSVAIAVLAMPALAQVELAAMRTIGIECGVCAAVSEINLRRLDGVEKVTISKSNESLMIAYSPGARFQPEKIREVLAALFVEIDVFQVRARGIVQEQAGKQFFVADRDRFVLAPATAGGPVVPPGTPVLIEAMLNDEVDPMELTVLKVNPVAE